MFFSSSRCAAPGVGEEVEEVVGLPVEPERVRRAQRERRVAHERVAVVPVAGAARLARQRRRRRRDDRAGRRVRQPLEGDRAALEVGAPRVVGEVAVREPVAPVLVGAGDALDRLVQRLRARMLGPADRDESGLALAQRRAGGEPRALEAGVQVGGAGQLDVRALAAGDGVVVARAGVLPARRVEAVVEARLALELQLDHPLRAARRADEGVVGFPVGRGAALAVGALGRVVPGADCQRVTDDQPARAHLPGGLDDHAARQVAARGRHLRVGGAEAEAARAAVEHRREHARRVELRQAEPFDVAARRDQRGDLAVGQQCVVRDRRESRPFRERERPHQGDRLTLN